MKKLKSISALVLCVLIFSGVVSGCKSQPAVIEEEIYALNTIINITVYDGSTESVDKAKKEIKRLEGLFSVTDENSDLSRVNSSPDVFVNVSEDTFNVIKTSTEVSENTNGIFDITVYPAVKIWGFTTDEYKVPEDSELAQVKKNIDYKKIELNETNQSVKVPNGMELDLGGIAKGYVADKAAEVLISNGVKSALLNFGGNIRLIGLKPDGSEYKIGIKAPFSDGYFAVLKANNTTISTAGGYERYFEENGKRYHHILNPSTASPAESDILSSTVVGNQGEVCDALATSVFIKGSEGIAELSEKYPDYGFIALTENAVYVSESLSDSLELTENYRNTEFNII